MIEFSKIRIVWHDFGISGDISRRYMLEFPDLSYFEKYRR